MRIDCGRRAVCEYVDRLLSEPGKMNAGHDVGRVAEADNSVVEERLLEGRLVT